MTQEKRIPLAWSARWRRIRLHAVPVASFAAAVATCAWLWQGQGGEVHTVGAVDVLKIDVTSPVAGLIVAMPHEVNGQWSLYDHVTAGETLARMDDRQLRSDQAQFRQEIRELVEEVNQWKATSAASAGSDAAESIDLAWQFEFGRLTSLLQSSVGMSVPAQTVNLEEMTSPPELPDAVSETAKLGLVRLRETRETLELRSDDLELRTESLEIRAPISGTLVAVHCWPGQAVPQGGRVATIAADHGQHIVSYLPEDSRFDPKPGMQVVLQPRTRGTAQFTSEVEQVGNQIQRIPSRYLVSPAMPQWGIPVRIKMPSDVSLRPGTVIDVVFSAAG